MKRLEYQTIYTRQSLFGDVVPVVANPTDTPLIYVGKKTGILGDIYAAMPAAARLIEPFVGSASVSLSAPFNSFLCADMNADLINLHRMIQSSPDELIYMASELFDFGNTQELFYSRRDEFNAGTDPMHSAALLLYLNRHCYCGMMRYNQKGGFNASFMVRPTVYFPKNEIRTFSKWSNSNDVHFVHQDFRSTIDAAQSGDVIYCDPPYVAMSETANFTGYVSGGFGPSDQTDLVSAIESAQMRGITSVVSNNDTPEARELYAGADEIITVGSPQGIANASQSESPKTEILAIFAGV